MYNLLLTELIVIVKNHTVARDQPTFKEYQIQVEAVNIIGNALVPPAIVRGFSGEDGKG